MEQGDRSAADHVQEFVTAGCVVSIVLGASLVILAVGIATLAAAIWFWNTVT